jgi:hypothetical protein
MANCSVNGCVVHTERILGLLLSLGRKEAYADISHEPELQPHMAVIQLLDKFRDQIAPYAHNLGSEDRIALTKAMAVLEHQVGGRGSVTHLRCLLPLVDDPDRLVFDWILRNTDSYAYWSHGTKSIEEFDSNRESAAKRSAEKSELLTLELQQQKKNREQTVQDANQRLYNAVRRGDIKALQALIAKGANVSLPTPDGMTLLEYAESQGNSAIVELLQSQLKAVPNNTDL